MESTTNTTACERCIAFRQTIGRNYDDLLCGSCESKQWEAAKRHYYLESCRAHLEKMKCDGIYCLYRRRISCRIPNKNKKALIDELLQRKKVCICDFESVDDESFCPMGQCNDYF